jgi:hypothetical protein
MREARQPIAWRSCARIFADGAPPTAAAAAWE